jgi:hypothetical protein
MWGCPCGGVRVVHQNREDEKNSSGLFNARIAGSKNLAVLFLSYL